MPIKLPPSFKQNPDGEPVLADLRHRQWRQPSRNPFEPAIEPTAFRQNSMDVGLTQSEGHNGNTTDITESLPYSDNPPHPERSQSSQAKESFVKAPESPKSPESEHPELKHPGSKWVHLFYDLAWTASFASLTQNGKFQNPLDTINYFLFFAAVMWLWASQTLYSIHFYTNDWFHLASTFFQLFLFGMLSATTLGYDVTTYIAHSPGIDKLRKGNEIDDSDPQQYVDEKTAYLSMLVLAIAFVTTRFIHLIQYVRVLYYANWSSKDPLKLADKVKDGAQGEVKDKTKDKPKNEATDKGGIGQFEGHSKVPIRPWIQSVPPQLICITAGLFISNPLFAAALGIAASDFGKTVLGASLKLGFWIGGFLIELFSHLAVPVYDWVQKLRSRSSSTTNADGQEKGNPNIPSGRELPVAPGMDLCERLQTITTIILGEGINGIAGTLSAVMVAPGVGRTVVVNVISAACTVWFIAYIYFEGPKGDRAPQITSLRYMIWLILHLPFLASTVLLLIGIKNQFLLTGFLSSLFGTTSGFNDIYNRELKGQTSARVWLNNAHMKHFLLERGLVWEDEFNKLNQTLSNTTLTPVQKRMATPVWSLRLSLAMAINAFKDFNKGDDDIINNLQLNITEYNDNMTQVIEDLNNQGNPQQMVYYQILSQLLKGTLQSTRYIIAFAGLILISLSLQDLIHSSPRDRYQWGVIASRFLMGIVLCLLLLLNIGRYQDIFVSPQYMNQRAGVFLWLEAFWVLPTITIGYAVQFLVEIALARFAKRATEQAQGKHQNEHGDGQEGE
ncbi:hypothetical protein OPQ81_000045 [Rhizoctonia solani]|nr:hypothetical protein OPQ81_000045 [Rhizoctonia solani]